MIFKEGREGMGSDFSYDRGHVPQSVVVAQEVLEQRGVPFIVVSQRDEPYYTDFSDDHCARVKVRINGTEREGFAISADVANAYAQAFWGALYPCFPQLSDCYPSIRQVDQDGHSHTELEFSTGSERWVSRNEGVAASSLEIGRLVAEGLMAGVHLTRMGK